MKAAQLRRGKQTVRWKLPSEGSFFYPAPLKVLASFSEEVHRAVPLHAGRYTPSNWGASGREHRYVLCTRPPTYLPQGKYIVDAVYSFFPKVIRIQV